MTDETRQSPAETVSHEHLKSVVHRRGPLTKADYSEAIGNLKRARMQDKVAHICCSVCEDTGHTAETCHHNPLLLARKWSEATSVWCCYHCGFTATNDAEALDHFGYNNQVKPKCLRRPLTQAEIDHVKEAFVRFYPDSDAHTEVSATILQKLTEQLTRSSGTSDQNSLRGDLVAMRAVVMVAIAERGTR